MTKYSITRHPDTQEWARRHHPDATLLTHLVDSRVIPIDVVVSYSKWSAELAWRMAKLAGTGSVTGLFGALVGGFTGKYWWPPVEAWMKARGWM